MLLKGSLNYYLILGRDIISPLRDSVENYDSLPKKLLLFIWAIKNKTKSKKTYFIKKGDSYSKKRDFEIVLRNFLPCPFDLGVQWLSCQGQYPRCCPSETPLWGAGPTRAFRPPFSKGAIHDLLFQRNKVTWLTLDFFFYNNLSFS